MAARSPRQRRSNQQQRALDQRIIALHQAIAEKLLSHPELLALCHDKLEQLYQSGQIRHGAYVFWDSIFLLQHDQQAFIAAMTDPGPKACKYRRKTPCSGVLSEQERLQLITAC